MKTPRALVPFAVCVFAAPTLAFSETLPRTIAALQAKAPTTILAARVVRAKDKTPEHCFVEGNVATPGNVVGFHVALPRDWNGKFLFQGNEAKMSTEGERAIDERIRDARADVRPVAHGRRPTRGRSTNAGRFH
jgi:hypothetical protein